MNVCQVAQGGPIAEDEAIVPGAAVQFKDLIFENIEGIRSHACQQAFDVHELKRVTLFQRRIGIGICRRALYHGPIGVEARFSILDDPVQVKLAVLIERIQAVDAQTAVEIFEGA